jgi:hypothetical protein
LDFLCFVGLLVHLHFFGYGLYTVFVQTVKRYPQSSVKFAIVAVVHPGVGGLPGATSPNQNLRNTDFCRHGDIKHFMQFALHPISATDIG